MLRRIVIVLAGLAILAIPAVSLAKSDPPRYMTGRMSEDAPKQWPAPPPEPAPVAVTESEPEPEPEVAPVKKPAKKKPAAKKKTCSSAGLLAGASASKPCSTAPKPAKKKSGCENRVVSLGSSGCSTGKPCPQSVAMGSEGCQSKPKPTSCTSSMLGVATTSGKCK